MPRAVREHNAVLVACDYASAAKCRRPIGLRFKKGLSVAIGHDATYRVAPCDGSHHDVAFDGVYGSMRPVHLWPLLLE